MKDFIKRLFIQKASKPKVNTSLGISDFILRPAKGASPKICNAIYLFHLKPAIEIQMQLGDQPRIVPTLIGRWGGGGSSFRHPEHEKERGRSITGEHTYKDGKGATDWSITDFDYFPQFGKLLMDYYRRLIVYPDNKFIHCDYREHSDQGPRLLVSRQGKVSLVSHQDFLKVLEEIQ